ncbi:hypothetical protein LCGC14_0533300 [marine sediment metagenome]|uniref:Uncharacterized protein n=1 Tax=marine sediment metagenome TaxID=412755 RepID=A0A0F9RV08_9ZZZZ
MESVTKPGYIAYTMITIEEFEDKLVAGINKISSQHLHTLIRPATLANIKYQVIDLLLGIGQELNCDAREKVIIKVESDYGKVTVSFLNPNDPIYHIHYDGTRGEIIDYHKYYHAKDLLSSFVSDTETAV